jgi:hypothetical protein
MRLIPVMQRLGALAVIFTDGLKFLVFLYSRLMSYGAFRKFFQDLEDTAFDDGHFSPLEALIERSKDAYDGCLLISVK